MTRKKAREYVLAILEGLIRKGLVVAKQDENGQTRYYPAKAVKPANLGGQRSGRRQQNRRRAYRRDGSI